MNIQKISKAIAALVAGAVISWAASQDIGIAIGQEDLAVWLTPLVGALISASIVYFAPANKESK